MNFERFLLSISVLAFILPFSGNTANAEEIAEQQFLQLVSDLNHFQASFEQTVVESDGYVLDETQGVMSFEKPNKLYWNVEEPFPSLLVSDAETLYFYDPDLNQVTLRPWSSDPSENPLAVFVSDTQILDYYSISTSGSDSGSQNNTEDVSDLYVLTPKSLDASYTELQILFDEKGIASMTVFDTIGQTTSIHFSELEENSLPDSPYEFRVPENAELIFDD